jgi:hypothetical protein
MEKINKLEETIYATPKYFGILELLEFIVFLIIVYKYNPFNIKTEHPIFTQFFVLITGFIYVMLLFFIKNNSLMNNLLSLNIKKPDEHSFLLRILSTLLFLGVFILLTISIFWLFRHTSFFTSLLKHSLSIIIIVGLISIIYLLTNKFFKSIFGNLFGKNNASFSGIIKNILLFLPCLLIKFIEYIRYEYNITSSSVWLILLLEIVLITLWYILPKILNYTIHKNGNILLDEPIYLNKIHTLGTFEDLHKQTINSKKEGTIKNNKFNYHYSLSAWFYINPQPTNTSTAYTRYTSILNYGNKPNVQYNAKKNSLRIITSLGTKDINSEASEVEIFETNDILYQKWNNIVINYDGGNMDVFLNGELVGSRPNIAPYMTYENVSSGEENGIHGGICNVVYYDHIISNKTIKLMHKILKNKEIPHL